MNCAAVPSSNSTKTFQNTITQWLNPWKSFEPSYSISSRFSSLRQPSRLSSNLSCQAPPLHSSHTLPCSMVETKEELKSFSVKYGWLAVLGILNCKTRSRQNLQYFMLNAKTYLMENGSFSSLQILHTLFESAPRFGSKYCRISCSKSSTCRQCFYNVQENGTRFKISAGTWEGIIGGIETCRRALENHGPWECFRCLIHLKWILHKRLEICVPSSTSYPLHS